MYGQLGVVTCGREKAVNAYVSRPNALSQIALGHQLQLNGTIQTIEHVRVGLPGKAANDLAHPARLEQGLLHRPTTALASCLRAVFAHALSTLLLHFSPCHVNAAWVTSAKPIL
jgi:hypothetical protein